MAKKTKTIPNTDSGEKSNIPNVKVGLDDLKDDMLKMMDKIDRLESAVRIIANRMNRVDGRR